jgi:hypothetical protein
MMRHNRTANRLSAAVNTTILLVRLRMARGRVHLLLMVSSVLSAALNPSDISAVELRSVSSPFRREGLHMCHTAQRNEALYVTADSQSAAILNICTRDCSLNYKASRKSLARVLTRVRDRMA